MGRDQTNLRGCFSPAEESACWELGQCLGQGRAFPLRSPQCFPPCLPGAAVCWHGAFKGIVWSLPVEGIGGNTKFWSARAFPHYYWCLWAPQKQTKEGDGLGQNVLFSFLFTSLDVRRETGMYWEGAAEAKAQADLISTILRIHTPPLRCSEPHPRTGEEKAKKVASNIAWLRECAKTD